MQLKVKTELQEIWLPKRYTITTDKTFNVLLGRFIAKVYLATMKKLKKIEKTTGIL